MNWRVSFLVIGSLILPSVAFAQELSRGIAEYVPIENANDIKQGQLISFIAGQYRLATIPYDENLAGIASINPSVAISYVGSAGTIPLVGSGSAEVLVQGPIEAGMYITSSQTAGVGQAAADPGFVIGRALGPSHVSANETALVPAAINPGFVWPEGSGFALGSILANPGETLTALPRPLRYIVSTLIILASLIAGYWMYSRTSSSTVAALGRNPLAKRSIYVLVGFHTAITIALVIVGLVLGYLILVF
ncbi:MAG: hypothetical protein HYR90_00065 [Candidatus Andersenbacteria bacterium]|nr:hypothetical protein [Candidatus Andersenbacteria bacterium]MBI3250801.1 hypothetical protein [Candidatus Andersenbacteria bacterium]